MQDVAGDKKRLFSQVILYVSLLDKRHEPRTWQLDSEGANSPQNTHIILLVRSFTILLGE